MTESVRRSNWRRSCEAEKTLIRGVIEICPYEPPASGWTTRVKLIRDAIRAGGAECDVLDVGPSRREGGRDCIPVLSGSDYIKKVLHFARRGFCVHGHINGSYFRGLLLALAALAINRIYRNRCVVTFHAGTVQPFFSGWRLFATWPFIALIFSLAHVVICNSEAEKKKLLVYRNHEKILPIQAFSQHYLEYADGLDSPDLEQFVNARSPLIVSYLCFREGFYVDEVFDGIGKLVSEWPDLGVVIVGTGDGEAQARQQIEASNLSTNIHIYGDATHDQFMTLLDRSAVYLRSYVADGVSASVLESLALGTPVVASENGTRPATVITYSAPDSDDLAEKVGWVLRNQTEAVASLESPDLGDTIEPEVNVLLNVRES